ncbi:MAG: YhfC family glutamic-type intramembrane protease [Ruthenibacterium sp.]|nr:YhfC family glutamic-type intramembrane protease [Ruthenibacterium sp.]
MREEHMDISFSAIAACWASAALCIVLPIALLVIVRVKTHRGLLAALTGALCFTVSALVLEQLLHSIVFSSFPTLIQSPGLYTAYACLAAGVFEETARYLGLSLLCRRDASLVTGFAYGIGHGGIEAILLAGTASLSNAIVLSAARGGSLEAMFGSDIAATVSAQLASGVSAGALLLPGLERVAAITLHLALSILVWMAVTGRLPKACLALSICLHAAANVGAALYQCGIFSILLAEVWTFAFVLAISLCVWYLYKKSAPRQTA